MVLKSDQERIKALLKDTITLLCRNGLTFKTEFSIEALIGITLDQDDVLLVNINEIVRNELGHKLAAEAQDSNSQGNELGVGSGDWDDNYSDTASQHSMTPSSNSKRKRKRRKSAGQGSKGDQESDDGGGSDGGESYAGPGDDPSTLSEPLAKRNSMSTSRTKSAVKQEDDDSKDIVFIKEEVDSGDWASTSQGQEGFPGDLSGIPSSSNSTLNPAHQESFDFLQGNSLIPMGGTPQQNANLWSDMTGRQNITSPSTKRTSTVTSAGSAGPSLADDSQQTYGRTIYSLASEQGSVEVKDAAEGQSKLFVCNICSRTLTTRRGLEAHMGQHLGIFRYKCGVCGKGFPSTTAMRDHERSHTGQKLSCPVCFKQFTSSMGIKHHMKSIHSFQAHGIFKSGQGAFTPFLGQLSGDNERKHDNVPKSPAAAAATREKLDPPQHGGHPSSATSKPPEDTTRETSNKTDVHTTRLIGDLFGRGEGMSTLARFEMMLKAGGAPGGRDANLQDMPRTPSSSQSEYTQGSMPQHIQRPDRMCVVPTNPSSSGSGSQSMTRARSDSYIDSSLPDVSLLQSFSFK